MAGNLAKVRHKRAVRPFYRAAVFVLGLAFIGLGIGLMALPGPLTIPPVLLGLWIWSTEFRFAERLFDNVQQRAREAWEHAKAHKVTTAVGTVVGLAAAAAAFWAVAHYDLAERARQAIL